MTEPAALEVAHLTKRYGRVVAVDDVSFVVPQGAVVGLLGPNGAGKSTTIQMLVGITEATSGRIGYFGRDFSSHKRECLQRINFTSAYNSLQEHITTYENLLVFAHLYSVPRPRRRIEALAEQLEVAGLLGQRFGTLSAGQKTRVNLVKAFLSDPALVLMDEPTASLDPDIRDKTLTLIEGLRASRNLSILYTSHNMDEVARLCDEVIFLDRGRIVRQDTPTNLTNELNEVRLHLVVRGDRQAAVAWLRAAGLAVADDEARITATTAKAEVAAVLAGLHRVAGVAIDDVHVERPTLETVFLEIARSEDVLVPH